MGLRWEVLGLLFRAECMDRLRRGRCRFWYWIAGGCKMRFGERSGIENEHRLSDIEGIEERAMINGDGIVGTWSDSKGGSEDQSYGRLTCW